ncbi:MAG: penicillin-binding protein, partial [Bacteroidota bacterium]
YDSRGNLIHGMLSEDDKWRMYSSMEELNPDLMKTILFKEDRWFYYHLGINPFAILRATFNNVTARAPRSGASTITMQVARLLYPGKRTLLKKVTEAFRALQLEWHYSKNEIFLMYINLIPFGGNIEGVKSASHLYFNTDPARLSLARLVTLTVIPNHPAALQPGRNDVRLQEMRNHWLRRMKQASLFPAEIMDDALREPLDIGRYPVPTMIPHLANRLAAGSDTMRIDLSLDIRLQKNFELMLRNYAERLKVLGVYNLSALCIRNEDMKVMAYCGSADFSDLMHHGQVDGIRAVRSPGSTLKPMVYALAFEEGWLSPSSVMSDVPVNFSGYAPENYSSTYLGAVSGERALAYSLNIPAVKTLHRVGLPAFTQSLSACGFSRIYKDRSRLGLSSVLGGCGVTLEELCGLYAMFSEHGIYRKMSFYKRDKPAVGRRIIRAEAAWMVSHILQQVQRPDFPDRSRLGYRAPMMAWKTGTSYGRRDAWSIGYNDRYTIGVWIGNFSGQGVPDLSGAGFATPLLFDLFHVAEGENGTAGLREPPGMKFRLVCEESGKVPSSFCEHQVTDFFIPGISDCSPCEHLVELDVNVAETVSYCLDCRPERGYKKKLYRNDPPDLIDYYKERRMAPAEAPPHEPSCERLMRRNTPTIVSPVNAKEYLLARDEESQLMLRSHSLSGTGKVNWFINDQFFCSAESGKRIFFSPPAGKVKISCAAERGLSSDIEITVRYY